MIISSNSVDLTSQYPKVHPHSKGSLPQSPNDFGDVMKAVTSEAEAKTGAIYDRRIITDLQDVEEVFDEINQVYDLRCATFEEFCEVAKILFNNGILTIKEFAVATFDLDRVSKEYNLPSQYCINTDSKGRRDWIAEYEAKCQNPLRNSSVNRGILQVLQQFN